MASRGKKQSLADKINNLVSAAPTIFGSDDETEETKAKVLERYDESGSGDDSNAPKFRKQNVDLLAEIDSRYKGKKVSRKDVYEDEDASDGSEMASDGSENEDLQNSEDYDSENEEFETGDNSSSNEDANSDSDAGEESEVDEENPLRRKRGKESNFQNITPANVRADVEKGNCVREQLKIWENLLEVRIKLQKCLISSNQLPQGDVYEEMKPNEKFTAATTEGKTKLSALLDNLLALQSNLLNDYPETRNLLKRGKKRKADKSNEELENEESDEEICSDTEEEMEKEEDADESAAEEDSPPEKKKKLGLADYEKIISENHKTYREYRNSVIQKWNDKTRVATGSVNKTSNQAIVKQIEFVLDDKSKLVKRTQLKRSEYEIIGKIDAKEVDGRRVQEYDTEIYDDDDFYHQLLRELIEYKSSDITDPIQLSKQWIALQNMRNKMKRKIDTRATKGRRIRYNVHTKLVNFMAPIDTNDTWSDLAKNELYNSLFGKIKSVNAEATPNEPDDETNLT